MVLLGIFIILLILFLAWFLIYYSILRLKKYGLKDLSLPEDDFANDPDACIWRAMEDTVKKGDIERGIKLRDYYLGITWRIIFGITLVIAIVGVFLMGLFLLYQPFIGMLISIFTFAVALYYSYRAIFFNQLGRSLDRILNRSVKYDKKR